MPSQCGIPWRCKEQLQPQPPYPERIHALTNGASRREKQQIHTKGLLDEQCCHCAHTRGSLPSPPMFRRACTPCSCTSYTSPKVVMALHTMLHKLVSLPRTNSIAFLSERAEQTHQNRHKAHCRSVDTRAAATYSSPSHTKWWRSVPWHSGAQMVKMPRSCTTSRLRKSTRPSLQAT